MNYFKLQVIYVLAGIMLAAAVIGLLYEFWYITAPIVLLLAFLVWRAGRRGVRNDRAAVVQQERYVERRMRASNPGTQQWLDDRAAKRAEWARRESTLNERVEPAPPEMSEAARARYDARHDLIRKHWMGS